MIHPYHSGAWDSPPPARCSMIPRIMHQQGGSFAQRWTCMYAGQYHITTATRKPAITPAYDRQTCASRSKTLGGEQRFRSLGGNKTKHKLSLWISNTFPGPPAGRVIQPTPNLQLRAQETGAPRTTKQYLRSVLQSGTCMYCHTHNGMLMFRSIKKTHINKVSPDTLDYIRRLYSSLLNRLFGDIFES